MSMGQRSSAVSTELRDVFPLPLDTPIFEDKVRFVCMSDTHCKAQQLCERIPPGDVYLHAGDFSSVGRPKEVEDFNNFLGTLPHKHKIVIAGNHELSFDEKILSKSGSFQIDPVAIRAYLESRSLTRMSEVLVNCTYLEDSETTVYGLRVYGSPWQPEFCEWAFNLPLGPQLREKWQKIPVGIDILMTHGPPKGILDVVCYNQSSAGCDNLRREIQKRIRPKYHVFGHIHEAYGMMTDGVTTYVNASNLDSRYRPVNDPVIFDIDLPSGISKSS